MEAGQESVTVDELNFGLDRARITRSSEIELPESHEASQDTNVQTEPESPCSSSHNVVDSIKQKKHKAGIKIRKTLHIGRASDDFELTSTAIVGGSDEPSGTRYASDPPEPEKVTMKDFIHNPLDTIRAKASEFSNQQVAAQITAKEVPHGAEVDLIHASEAVEDAKNDAQRLLAIQDLSKLMEERQTIYARWTLDRHVTKVRLLSQVQIELKPRSEFEKYNSLEGVVIDWRAYGQHVTYESFSKLRGHANIQRQLLMYYASRNGKQYIGYGSNPPAPSKQTIVPNIERLLVASSPLQEMMMTSRRVYRWEQPAITCKYLAIYSVLWYFNMLLPGCVSLRF